MHASATLLQAWPEVNDRPRLVRCGFDSVTPRTVTTRRCATVSSGRGRCTVSLNPQSITPSPMARHAAIITTSCRPRKPPKISVSATAAASGQRQESKSLTRAMSGSSHGPLHARLICQSVSRSSACNQASKGIMKRW